jgi:hypothetical protein
MPLDIESHILLQLVRRRFEVTWPCGADLSPGAAVPRVSRTTRREPLLSARNGITKGNNALGFADLSTQIAVALPACGEQSG